MAIVWEQRVREADFVKQMLLSILISGIVSAAWNFCVPRSHAVSQCPADQHELGAVKGGLNSLEVRLRKTTLATAALHRDFTVLTAENGILSRVIADMQAIREENAALTQTLHALQASPTSVSLGAAAVAPDPQAAQTSNHPRHRGAAELTIVTAARPPDLDQSESQDIGSSVKGSVKGSVNGNAKAAIKPSVQGG